VNAYDNYGKVICVWPQNDVWIISLDALDEYDRAETTNTLHVEESESAAIDKAKIEGGNRGVAVYRNHEGRPKELLQMVQHWITAPRPIT
jgi:hypothetical protein